MTEKEIQFTDYSGMALDWTASVDVRAGELRVSGGQLYRRKVAGTTAATFAGEASSWDLLSGGTGTGANAVGTFNNPVTDPAAARPTGLTRVVWDCATDPTNWAVGDYNLQQGP